MSACQDGAEHCRRWSVPRIDTFRTPTTTVEGGKISIPHEEMFAGQSLLDFTR
jgi:hypothetical protein